MEHLVEKLPSNKDNTSVYIKACNLVSSLGTIVFLSRGWLPLCLPLRPPVDTW